MFTLYCKVKPALNGTAIKLYRVEMYRDSADQTL